MKKNLAGGKVSVPQRTGRPLPKDVSAIHEEAPATAYSAYQATGVRRTMKASEFKAKCLQVMDEVAASGEPVVITKNGVPLTRLEPYKAARGKLAGAMKGTFAIKGDVVAPLGVRWKAEG